MVKVESFKYETCGKIYQTEEECKVCEEKCADSCDVEYNINVFEGENITVKFNYGVWKHILDFLNEDIFYIEMGYNSSSLSEMQLDKLIKSLQEIKDIYRRKKLINSIIDKK